jgi:hypothetical protein
MKVGDLKLGHFYIHDFGLGLVHYLLYKKTPPTLKTIRFESGAEERYAGQKTGLTTWKITPVLEGKLELDDNPPKIDEEDCRKFFRWIWWADFKIISTHIYTYTRW